MVTSVTGSTQYFMVNATIVILSNHRRFLLIRPRLVSPYTNCWSKCRSDATC